MSIKTTDTVLPIIYCYSTPGVTYHDGWVKIGYTEQDDVDKRLKQQTNTAGIRYQLEWNDYAIFKRDSQHRRFTDDDFKAYLVERGVNCKNEFGANGESIGDEWYQISPAKTLAHFQEFAKEPSFEVKLRTYNLRAEQKQAVADTKEAYEEAKTKRKEERKEEEEHKYLWNAKPRFGKCLSCYDFLKQIDAKKVLIVTNRPAVATSWYNDYKTFLGRESGYFFVSHISDVKDKELVIDYREYEKDEKARATQPDAQPMKMIYFASLQDIKGARCFGGDIEKLRELTTIEWDVLVIDESHEGVDTQKTDAAFDRIKRGFTLYLSGTPFKAMKNEDFDTDEIYNWTYVSEQEAKENWDGNGTNPYFQMPKLHMMTYRLSGIIEEDTRPDLTDSDETVSTGKLNELFKVEGGKFVRDKDVDIFLDAISSNPKYPFGDSTSRLQLEHTFWLLNRVDSANELEKKLNAHPIFSQYKIINVAGVNNSYNAYGAVIKKIENNPRTITLSAGRLTTGITIPQWTGVMMLSERKSATEYMQASFRAQNPYILSRKNEMTGTYECKRKTDAYVFDFDPENTLDIVDQFATNLYSDTAAGKGTEEDRKRRIDDLLRYLPVTGETEDGTMEALDSEQVILIPRKARSQEVVRRGFMCNHLFQNISNVFSGLTKAGLDIANKFPKCNDRDKVSAPMTVTEEEIADMHLNDEGEVEVTDEDAKAVVDSHVSKEEKKGATEEIKKEIQKVIPGNTPDTKKDAKTEQAAVADALTKKLQEEAIERAKEMQPDLPKSAENDIKRAVKDITSTHVSDIFVNSKIDLSDREAEIEESFKGEKTEEDKKVLEELKEEARKEVIEERKQTILDSMPTVLENVLEKTARLAAETGANKIKDDKVQELKERLKSFTRTIPSFLMAYGDDDFTLENLDTKVPDDVFKEVTSITLSEFRILRDECHYFDPTVFNDSVKVFLKKRDELSDYFDEGAEEDIFNYIPAQKTNQIFTPKDVIVLMADLLEKENPGCFDNADNTFIDPYMKSGMFVTEIAKRLFNSETLKEKYPDRVERLQHIFAEQVYGLAPTEIIYQIATHYIFGFADKKNLDISRKNFRCFDALPPAQAGKMKEELEKEFSKQ